jgi:hypothetical protein
VLSPANLPVQGNKGTRENKKSFIDVLLGGQGRRDGRKTSLPTREEKYEINDASELAVLLNSFKICL